MEVFVYGTLKVGGRYAHQFNRMRSFVTQAKVKGTMYSVGGSYPAVVLDGDTEIVGEVHQYPDDKRKEILARLDSIEGYRGPDNANNLYNRKEVEVTTAEGKSVKAMMYVFNREVAQLEKVADGYWPV